MLNAVNIKEIQVLNQSHVTQIMNFNTYTGSDAFTVRVCVFNTELSQLMVFFWLKTKG